MSVAVLVRNETIKTSRRPAFLVAVIVYVGLVAIMGVDGLQDAALARNPRPFHLPISWPILLENAAPVGTFFVSITLLLLIASEFSWRTARQNVIDGLSKEQWFLGKVLLLPMVGVVFLVVVTLVGGIVGAVGTDFSSGVQLIRAGDLRFLGGFGVAVLGYASLALFFATTIRNSGPAMAVFFLYVAFLERLFAELAGVIKGEWRQVLQYLPTQVFNSLLNERVWYPDYAQRMIAEALKAKRPPPSIIIPDAGTQLGWTFLYIALLIAISFVVFRKRDL